MMQNVFDSGAWKDTALRLTVFIAIAEEAGDFWLVDALLRVKDKLHRGVADHLELGRLVVAGCS
jgi:hypothetical protein